MCGLAVRIIRGSRVGIAGSSANILSSQHLRDLLKRAEVGTRNSESKLEAFASRAVANARPPRLHDLDDAIACAQGLSERLPSMASSQVWRAGVCLRHRTTTIINDTGAKYSGYACHVSVDLRLHTLDLGHPIEKSISVTSATIDDAIERACDRVTSELTTAYRTKAIPSGTRIVLGPPVVARLLERTIVDRLHTGNDWTDIPMVDTPGTSFGGVDDEGVPLDALGDCPHLGSWATLSTERQGGALVGRGFRPTIGLGPRLRPLGLRWLSSNSVVPPRYAMVNELVGMRLTPSGTIVGTAVGSPLFVGSEMIAQCEPMPIEIEYATLYRALSERATTHPSHIGPHFVPGVLMG